MSKQINYRTRRIAAGAKPLYALLSSKALANLDDLRHQAGLSRAQLLERMFKNRIDSASLPD